MASGGVAKDGTRENDRFRAVASDASVGINQALALSGGKNEMAMIGGNLSRGRGGASDDSTPGVAWSVGVRSTRFSSIRSVSDLPASADSISLAFENPETSRIPFRCKG